MLDGLAHNLRPVGETRIQLDANHSKDFSRPIAALKNGDDAEISVMLTTMTAYRHLLVGLLALALTVGTGWQSCATLQQQRLSPIASIDRMASHEDHQHHQHANAHDHDGLGNNQAVAVAHKRQPASDDHSGLKCCGACMLTSVIPPGVAWTLTPVVSILSFASPGEQLRGHIAFVDPEIPKRIA